MSAYFTDPAARHRIELRPFDGSEHWVEIVATLARVDRLALEDSMLAFDGTAGREHVNVAQRRDRQFRELMRRTVRAWSFPVPVNDTAIATMNDRLGEWLAREIDGYYKRQRAEQAGSDADFIEPASISTEAAGTPRLVRSLSSSLNGSDTATPIALGY